MTARARKTLAGAAIVVLVALLAWISQGPDVEPAGDDDDSSEILGDDDSAG